MRDRMRSESSQHVLRALRGLVLDEVRLVDDHAAEAEVADPAHVAVEHLVVDDDDVGEAVDRVAVAVDHGGRAVRRPEAGLAGPVGLDDVRHDHEQRVGVRRLRGEQRLRRLAQARLVGEQEGPVAGRGRGDQLRLVRHQLQAARRVQGGRRGQGHARRGSAAGALERAEQRAEQLPAGQAARTGRALPGGREVGGEERVGQLPRDDRLRHDPALGGGGGGRGLRRRDLVGGRLDAGGPQHVPRERPGRVGDDGVLGEQREQRGVADGGLREDRRDPVEALELLGPAGCRCWSRPPGPGRAPRAPAARRPGTSCARRASRGRAGRPPRPRGRCGRAPR